MSSDFRIVGGKPYNATDFGYFASLRIQQYNYHFCGAAIVAPYWAVTAAHCSSAMQVGPLEIVVGTQSILEGGQRYNVSKIVIHPKFNITILQNDLALVKTTSPVDFNEKVYPIKMAATEFYIGPGIDLTVFGWGLTSYPNGTVPINFHYIRLRSITNTECTARYAETGVPEIEIYQLCTYNDVNEGSCKGDSGGPLVSQDILMGIVSWGVPCGQGYPDVHTRVAYFRTWIDSIIEDDEDSQNYLKKEPEIQEVKIEEENPSQ
ncbi:chymotrypsin-2-like [Phlebotomus papatasi]|uniref:chymotrypsin-2-like n=1 Tax=Phlebotomus papatasi TaxID=29031 RepID=UPI00248378E1|nr:chymotrypsin-2-like [Phlebotomus papatasi]